MRILLVVLTLASFVFASIGKISSVRGDVLVVRNNQNIQAYVGQDLQTKDTILTKKHSSAQIIFSDDTSVNIGHDSSFSIREYLVENKDNSKVSLRANGGAIRVITGEIGKIAPKRFKLSTKTSTIGIRGTNFMVLSNGDNEDIYCSHGKIVVNSKNKEVLVSAGYYVQIKPDIIKPIPRQFTPRMLKGIVHEEFRNYDSQSSNANKSVESDTLNQSNSKTKTENKADKSDKKSNTNNKTKSSSDNELSTNTSLGADNSLKNTQSNIKNNELDLNDIDKDKLVKPDKKDKPLPTPDDKVTPIPDDEFPIDSNNEEMVDPLLPNEIDKDFISQRKVATYTTKGQKFQGQYLSADTREIESLSSYDFMEMTFDFGAPGKFLKKMSGFIGGGVETSYIKDDENNNIAFNEKDLIFSGNFSEHGTLSGKFSSRKGKFIENGKILNKNSNGQNLIDAQFEAIRK